MEALYNHIGRDFHVTRRSDGTIVDGLTRALGLRADGKYLDLGCGTGNYAASLSSIGGRWYAIDNSTTMLEYATTRQCHVEWTLGAAEQLPYTGRFFDGIICVNAFHLFEVEASLLEAARVLADGKLVIFSPMAEQISNYWLREYFPNMIHQAIRKMPRKEQTCAQLIHAGFDVVELVPFEVTKDLADHFLYCGKQRPHLYFDPAIVGNISQFVRWCSTAELRQGQQRLSGDLASGRFQRVVEQYSSGDGDCTFIVSKRRLGGLRKLRSAENLRPHAIDVV